MRLVLVITIIILFVNADSLGQSRDSTRITYVTRNGVGITPVYRNVIINGLAIGYMGKPWRGAESLKINGMNVDASPFALFGGVLAFVGTFLSPFNSIERNDARHDELGFSDAFPDSTTSIPETDIKCVSLSVGLLKDCELRGAGINAFVSFADQTNGLELTGIMNLHFSFKGVIVAGLRNKTTTGSGLQIGLFNSCMRGRVIQFGLLNRVGSRVLPILNFSLPKRSRRILPVIP